MLLLRFGYEYLSEVFFVVWILGNPEKWLDLTPGSTVNDHFWLVQESYLVSVIKPSQLYARQNYMQGNPPQCTIALALDVHITSLWHHRNDEGP